MNVSSTFPTLSLKAAGVEVLDCEHKTPERIKSGYPYVAIPNIKDGRLHLEDVSYISEEDYQEWTRRTKPEPGDVIVTRRGRVGDTAAVPYGLKCALGQNLVILRTDETHLRQDFLLWLTRSPHFDWQVQKYMNEGAVFSSLNVGDFPSFELPVPPLPIQRRIADILGALDDKIALNRQMNATLEAMVQALYQHWFVDFGPFQDGAFVDSELGPIPEGWTVESIYEIANVIYGAPFKSKYFNDGDKGLPLIKNGDLKTHDPKSFTDENHPKATVIHPGDVLVGMDGEFRSHLWTGPVSYLNQRVCEFVPRTEELRGFLLFALKRPLAFYEQAKTGTTVIHLGKRDINKIQVVIPPPEVLQTFSEQVEPLLDQIVTNSNESRTLAETRDYLLPKLIAGEISVDAAEEQVEVAV